MANQKLVMLSQQDQEIRRNAPDQEYIWPDPSFAGGSHLCGSGAGNETNHPYPPNRRVLLLIYTPAELLNVVTENGAVVADRTFVAIGLSTNLTNESSVHCNWL